MELLRSITILILLLSSTFAESIPDFKSRSIRQFPLDDHTVYDIKIGKDEVTTLTFPGPVSALESANITADPRQNPAAVLLSYQEGRSYFSVRSLAENTAASLNVIYKKRTYVFRLITDKEPYRSVVFYEPEEATESLKEGSGTVTPSRLLSLIDRAKVHHLIEAQHPELISTLEIALPHQRFFYRDFEVVLEEVFRFEQEDTLVFKVLLFNKINQDIYYQPQTLGVRAGTRVFYSSLADASGIMKAAVQDPKTKTIQPNVSVAYFAITGTPDGGRNNLSVKNAFNVLVTRLPDSPKS